MTCPLAVLLPMSPSRVAHRRIVTGEAAAYAVSCTATTPDCARHSNRSAIPFRMRNVATLHYVHPGGDWLSHPFALRARHVCDPRGGVRRTGAGTANT